MVRVRSENSTGIVNVHFTPPLFDWHTVPARFFKMIDATLPPQFTDDPSFFSVTTGNSLDEVSAKYNILGGPDIIALSAKMLSMEFREFSVDSSVAIRNLVQDVETGFITHFPECIYDGLEVISSGHLAILDDSVASEYLERYTIASIDGAFGDGSVEKAPSGRFSVKDTQDTWSASCFVEKSRMLDDGLFVHVQTSLLKSDVSDGPQERYDRVAEIFGACLRTLDLERDR